MKAKPKTVAVDLAPILEGLGLPRPAKEFLFYAGRKWRFDYAWIGAWVALEIEGGTYTRGRHVRAKGYANDIEKYNAAGLLGWLVIRATWEQVESGEAVAWLKEALATHGV